MQRKAVGIRLLFLFSVLLALPLGAHAASHGSGEAQRLLKRIQSAAQHRDYSGTFVYQQGNQVRTSRIAHLFRDHRELEKLEVLDGQPREYVRTNDEIVCYVPDARTVLVEKRLTHDVFPAILGASPGDLASHYSIRLAGSGRVAGRAVHAVLLDPKDGFRYGYSLWADDESGLLLKAQTLGGKGDLIEQIAFTHIVIGNVDRSQVRPSVRNTKGWRVENAVMRPADLPQWRVLWVPEGFKKIREVKRELSETSDAAANGKGRTREVSQIVFSDGLAAISVFIEPAVKGRSEGVLSQGAMNIEAKRLGDFWLTIVGEVPSEAIHRVSESIEHLSRK